MYFLFYKPKQLYCTLWLQKLHQTSVWEAFLHWEACNEKKELEKADATEPVTWNVFLKALQSQHLFPNLLWTPELINHCTEKVEENGIKGEMQSPNWLWLIWKYSPSIVHCQSFTERYALVPEISHNMFLIIHLPTVFRWWFLDIFFLAVREMGWFCDVNVDTSWNWR